jgi:hypothetical protein
VRKALEEGFWVPREWRRRTGLILAGLLALAAAVFVANQWLHDARREVVVELGVNDEEYVFVNCVKAVEVLADESDSSSPARTPISLGWLRPEDRITFEYFNSAGPDVVPDFRATSNGAEFLASTKGSEAFAEISAPVGKYPYVRSFTAAGDPLGNVGCQHGDRIADEAGPYIRLPDDLRNGGRSEARPTFSPPEGLDAIDVAAPILIAIVAGIGFLLAIPILVFEWRRHGGGFLVVAIGTAAGALAIAEALPLDSRYGPRLRRPAVPGRGGDLPPRHDSLDRLKALPRAVSALETNLSLTFGEPFVYPVQRTQETRVSTSSRVH